VYWVEMSNSSQIDGEDSFNRRFHRPMNQRHWTPSISPDNIADRRHQQEMERQQQRIERARNRFRMEQA